MALAELKNGIIEANCDIFIIPNPFIRIGEYCVDSFNEKSYRLAEDILSHYNQVPDEDELLTQVWITSKEDLGTENLSDHGCQFLNSGEEEYANPKISAVPSRIFESKKEGDIVDIQFKHSEHIRGGDNFECEFILHCRLAQTEYRYSRFGLFEDVFNKLKAKASPSKKKEVE